MRKKNKIISKITKKQEMIQLQQVQSSSGNNVCVTFKTFTDRREIIENWDEDGAGHVTSLSGTRVQGFQGFQGWRTMVRPDWDSSIKNVQNQIISLTAFVKKY